MNEEIWISKPDTRGVKEGFRLTFHPEEIPSSLYFEQVSPGQEFTSSRSVCILYIEIDDVIDALLLAKKQLTIQSL